MTDRWKRLLVTVIQYGVALAALWYVLGQVELERTAVQLGRVSASVVAGIAVITVLEFGSRFTSWYVLVNDRTQAPFRATARIDLVIKFINHVIPSKASGHSVAPLVLRHYTDLEWSDAVSLAGVNTGLYAALYGVAALVGAGLIGGRLSPPLLAVIVLSTVVYLAAGVVVLLAGRKLGLATTLFDSLEALVSRVPLVGSRLAGLVAKAPEFTEESAAAFRDVSSNPRVLVPYGVAWLCTLMVFPGLRVLLVLGGLGVGFSPPWLVPFVLVAAYSVTVLPLTPGGVGVAEASASLVLVSLGVPEEAAVAVIVIDRLFGVYLPAILGSIPMATLDLNQLLLGDG
jgi:uncharacterized protein (TIRG00374 family)